MSCARLSIVSSHGAFRYLTPRSAAKPWSNSRHVIIWTRRQSTRVTAGPAVKAPPLIYVLGSGNDARFFATSIDAGPAQGLCRLLMDSERRFQDFFDAGAKIEVQENGQTVTTSFVGAELVKPLGKDRDSYRPPLNSMIVPQFSPDPNLQHIPSPSREEEKLYYDRGVRDVGKPVRFHSDSLTLNYGEEQRMQIGGSTPLSQAELDNLRRLANESNGGNSLQFSEADLEKLDKVDLEFKSGPIEKSDEPIEYLIAAMPTDLVFEKIKDIQHRLSRNSTILIPLRGGGLIDKINQELFPDPATRPTYIPAILIHSLWSTTHGYFSITSTGDEIEQKLLNTVETTPSRYSFAVNHLPGRLIMSEAIRFPEESPADRLWRKRHSEYLVKALKGTPLAGVELLPQDNLRVMQVRALVMHSVVHSLSIKYGCCHGGILLHKERWGDVKDLCREAAQVFQFENPYIFSAKDFEDQVVKYIRAGLYSVSRAFTNAVQGRDPGTEWFNGFIAKLGRERGITCTAHERLAAFLDEFAEARRIRALEEKEARYNKVHERRVTNLRQQLSRSRGAAPAGMQKRKDLEDLIDHLEGHNGQHDVRLSASGPQSTHAGENIHSVPSRPGEIRLVLDESKREHSQANRSEYSVATRPGEIRLVLNDSIQTDTPNQYSS